MNREEQIDAVLFFRKIKQKISKQMKGMTLVEKQVFLRKIKEGKITL